MATFNAYMENTLGITVAAVRQAVRAQGYDTFEAFTGTMDDDIVNTCKVIRQPGGEVFRTEEAPFSM